MTRRWTYGPFYVILDTQVQPYDVLWETMKICLRHGVGLVQLRDKTGEASQMLRFAREAVRYLKRRMGFIVNDRVDVAVLSGADGVHVGQSDIPVRWARRLMGKDRIVGVSCQTLDQVRRALRDGADYIGLGSMFPTKTKPGRRPMARRELQRIVETITRPFYAIGGITLTNVDELLPYGVSRVAVTRAVLEAPDPAEVIEEFQRRLAH